MSLITINGLSATINLPNAPKGEGVHQLPPYAPITPLLVDDYPACPTSWLHGSGKAASYFIRVEPGKHLWIDLNANWHHSHHVAAVLSVQGLNPATYLPTELRLEQYRDKCPKCAVTFAHNRFCPTCKRTWAPQNYMSTVSHKKDAFWADGWQIEDGVIRGFLITEETIKGVAAQILKDERVFAIGIAFFVSKEPKPVMMPSTHGFMKSHNDFADYSGSPIITSNMSDGHSPVYGSIKPALAKPMIPRSSRSNRMLKSRVGTPGPRRLTLAAAAPVVEQMRICGQDVTTPTAADSDPSLYEAALDAAEGSAPIQEVDVKKAEIAAGARIRQEVVIYDPSELSYYKDEPEGLLYINFCLPDDYDKIIAAGKKARTHSPEGGLAGLIVGND